MKTEAIPTEPHHVKKFCDCGGEYIATGMVLTSYPAQYPHECDKCGGKVTLDFPYPTIMHIPKQAQKPGNTLTDAEAMEEMHSIHAKCRVQDPDGWYCNRRKGHKGEHIACGSRVHSRWPQDEQAHNAPEGV